MNIIVLPHVCEKFDPVADWFVKQKRTKQIEFCGCIIAGVHGTFAAGSSILGILFDQNLNHLDIHGKWIKLDDLRKWTIRKNG